MRRFLVPFALVIALIAASIGAAQSNKERKYDFALVRKSGGMASWGSWNWSEQFRSKGPGLYVKKGDQTYVITDAETIKRAEAAMEEFKRVGDKMKQSRHARKNEAHAKAMAETSKEQEEIGRQMREASEEFEREFKNGANPEAERRYHEKMERLGEKMKAVSKKHRVWNSEAFSKEMEQFGRQMEAAGKVAGDKIVRLIDIAFEKGLARKV